MLFSCSYLCVRVCEICVSFIVKLMNNIFSHVSTVFTFPFLRHTFSISIWTFCLFSCFHLICLLVHSLPSCYHFPLFSCFLSHTVSFLFLIPIFLPTILPCFVFLPFTFAVPPTFSAFFHLSWPASPPIQGMGGNNGRGTEHTDPPQRGSSSPALCQWPDGHLLKGSFNCSVGHGFTHWHQSTSGPGGTPSSCQCGRLWRQIHCVCFRGSNHQGKKIHDFYGETFLTGLAY